MLAVCSGHARCLLGPGNVTIRWEWLSFGFSHSHCQRGLGGRDPPT